MHLNSWKTCLVEPETALNSRLELRVVGMFNQSGKILLGCRSIEAKNLGGRLGMELLLLPSIS